MVGVSTAPQGLVNTVSWVCFSKEPVCTTEGLYQLYLVHNQEEISKNRGKKVLIQSKPQPSYSCVSQSVIQGPPASG